MSESPACEPGLVPPADGTFMHPCRVTTGFYFYNFLYHEMEHGTRTVKDSKRRSAFVTGSGSDYEEVEKLQKKTRGFEDEYLKEMEEQRKQRRELEQLKFINDAVLTRRVETRNEFPVLISNIYCRYHIIHFLNSCGRLAVWWTSSAFGHSCGERSWSLWSPQNKHKYPTH